MSQQIYMNYIHPSSLLKQLSVLWRTDQLCDAVITIDKVIVAKAHKLVLFAISPKLKREHSLSQQSSILQVDLPSGISSSSAEAFLQYMYEGFLVLTEPLVRDLSRIAKHLDIQCLIKCCNDYQSKLDAGTLHKPETEFDDEAVNTSADFPHVRRFCVKNNKNAAGVNSSNFGPQAKRSRIMSPNVKETLDVRKKQTDGDGPGNSTPTSEGQSKQNSFPQFIVKTTSRQNTDQGSTDPRICKIEVAERSTCSYDSDARESQSTQHTVYSHSSIPPSSQASKETFEGNESLKNIKTEPEEIDDDCEISGVTMADNSYSYAHDTQQSDYSHSDLDQSDMMRFEVSAAPPSDLNESYMNEHSMNKSDTGQDASVQPGSSRLNANEVSSSVKNQNRSRQNQERRGRFFSYTHELRLEIGKYAQEHSRREAREYFSEDLGYNISESETRHMIKYYNRHVAKSKTKDKDEH